MKTFPHHFHLGGEKDVWECPEVFIEDVLPEIESIMNVKGTSDLLTCALMDNTPFPPSEEAEPEDLRLLDHKSKSRLGLFLMKKRPSPPQVAAGLAEYAPGGQGSLAASFDKPFMQLMLGWPVLRRGRLILWICASSFLVVSARG